MWKWNIPIKVRTCKYWKIFFRLKIPVARTREISQKVIWAAIELELPNFFKVLFQAGGGGGGGASKDLSWHAHLH